jgi:hypothetical protein
MGLVQYDSSDEDEEVQTPVAPEVPALFSLSLSSLLSSAEMHTHASSTDSEFGSQALFITHSECAR